MKTAILGLIVIGAVLITPAYSYADVDCGDSYDPFCSTEPDVSVLIGKEKE
ncbi:MAG: hypothetical protein R3240_10320 [Gammaproteobacteria bacterium]|nr:hypothetical protein [Gammaproteobacteria bacterium]